MQPITGLGFQNDKKKIQTAAKVEFVYFFNLLLLFLKFIFVFFIFTEKCFNINLWKK